MKTSVSWGFLEETEEFPELAPIIAAEKTADGWCGLTAEGEVYNVVQAIDDAIPESIVVTQADQIIGQRKITNNNLVSIARYLTCFKAAVIHHRDGNNEQALIAIDDAIGIVDTLRARFNRAMILLSLGQWPEGFKEFEQCERSPPFQRPASRTALDAGATPWRGEVVAGKRLLVVHDHGFGDTIMCLRYIKHLQAMGADVVLSVPLELTKIASQFGIVTANSLKIAALSCDYFTSFLHLLRWLTVTPTNVPTGTYVTVDPTRVAYWRALLPCATQRRVGLAWSVGMEQQDDFPRSLPLKLLLHRSPADLEFHSVQQQGGDDATALGVAAHSFSDFSDCAAFMMCMDEIISVDTAAVHLAAAIGHPNVTCLLSKWHSWRWWHNPFYPQVQIKESGR